MDKKDILFYISRGHGQMTAAGIKDPGAVSGKFVEADLAEKCCGFLREYLIAKRGIMTYRVAYPERHGNGMHLQEHVNEINAYRKKYRTVAIDWHFNAGGGTGCECCIDSNNRYSKKLAELILTEQNKIGRPVHSWNGKLSNAIHVRDELIFLKADGPVLLFEAGYVDNAKDHTDFDNDEKLRKIAEAVGKALIKYYEMYN